MNSLMKEPLKPASIQEPALLTLVKAHSISKTPQEHAVTHFLKDSISSSSIKLNAWPVSRFSKKIQKSFNSANLGTLSCILNRLGKTFWEAIRKSMSHTALSFYILFLIYCCDICGILGMLLCNIYLKREMSSW